MGGIWARVLRKKRGDFSERGMEKVPTLLTFLMVKIMYARVLLMCVGRTTFENAKASLYL